MVAPRGTENAAYSCFTPRLCTQRNAIGMDARLDELVKATCMAGNTPRKKKIGLSRWANNRLLYTTKICSPQARYSVNTKLPSGKSCSKPYEPTSAAIRPKV